MFKPLDFLANVTQHIPGKGEHQIRYYGFYSNKKRGMREKNDLPKDKALSGVPNGDTTFVKKRKITWAALIKCVYEVDPLKCPTAQKLQEKRCALTPEHLTQQNEMTTVVVR